MYSYNNEYPASSRSDVDMADLRHLGSQCVTPCIGAHKTMDNRHNLTQLIQQRQNETGNHDDFSLMQQYLNSAQVNCDKQLILKGWQIISLNSKKEADQGGYLETKELDFLDEQLKSHAHLHTVIAVHHHPVPTKSLWMDKMIIKNNDQLFTLLLKYPQVKAITCGHIHQQLDISENNIRIYGSPATCFQFKPECREYTLDNKKPGYRIVKLYEDSSIQSNIYRIENVS